MYRNRTTHFNLFNLFICFVFALVICGIGANIFFYSQRPPCDNGMQVQDDTGRFVCVDPNKTIIVRGTRRFR